MSVTVNSKVCGIGDSVVETPQLILESKKQNKLNGAWYFPGWKDNPNHPFGPPWDKSWFWLPNYPSRTPLGGAYDEGKQEVMDNTMQMAIQGGIDFFAFNYYYNSETGQPEGDHAIKNFISSKVDGIKFAIGFESHTSVPPVKKKQDWVDILRLFAKAFKSDKYLRINGRPVVFMVKMDDIHNVVTAATGMTHAELLQSAKDITKEDIYFVACAGVLNHWIWQAKLAGYDCYSQYNLSFAWTDKDAAVAGASPTNFAQLAANYATEWNYQVKKLDIDFWLPTTTGFDSRPWAGSAIGIATTTELRAHFQAAKAVLDSSSKCIGSITYAWNEHGEGGWMYPDITTRFEKLAVHRSVFKS